MAAFVNESLTRPPEIYLRRGGGRAIRLTHLNDHVASLIHYSARALSWRSPDGTVLGGWLLEPDSSRGRRPWPLITHVHGGPNEPMTDSFAPYFPTWPYPLEALAEKGFAVFIPNYRGTHSYGRSIAEVPRSDVESVDDVVSGVKSLVDAGIADRARLGIAGHSHGGWLGPMAMVRDKHLFAAGTFAEGISSRLTIYDLSSGAFDREMVEPLSGGLSAYDSPARYLLDSPNMHFDGVVTPSLFEAGAQSMAIAMTGFPKAARHVGMPTEYIVLSPHASHHGTAGAAARSGRT